MNTPLPPKKQQSSGGSKVFLAYTIFYHSFSNPVNVAYFCKHTQKFIEPERQI